MNPTHPVYVISKGRHDCCLTARFLVRDRVPFRLVVEPQEVALYEKEFGGNDVCTIVPTPFSNLGLGGIPARNFVWEHAIGLGAERHWILDDNIRGMIRLFRGLRLPAEAGPMFTAAEAFIARYENLAVAGMNYDTFAITPTLPPFYRNVHVYSCLCIDNALPFRWRGRYNEDTDLCLQALARGYCTVLFNAFLIQKMATLTMKGGNTAELYKGDGRLRMARSLERQWPGVVETRRRFQRPQHYVKDNWRRFDTPLRLKPGIALPTETQNFGMRLESVAPVQSPAVRHVLETQDGPDTGDGPPPAKRRTPVRKPAKVRP